MCGFFAVIGKFSDDEARQYARLGHELQSHRGPDGKGDCLLDLGNGNRALLGHQRLSIIDLSDHGLQPMQSASQRSVIAFNGEIYNYRELAGELGVALKTSSDTEVLLELAEKTGLAQALEQAIGMWGLAFVDVKDRTVHIARDRAGKKPLYVWLGPDRAIVASELKTVAGLSGATFAINTQVLGEYIEYGLQDSSDASWLEGIESLPAGAVASIRLDEGGPRLDAVRPRWQPQDPEGKPDSFEGWAERVRSQFANAMTLRLRADVPVGVTLSGGVDSSIIAAEMVRQIGDPGRIHAISAVSPGQVGDESLHIDRVCNALGIQTHRVDLGLKMQDTVELMPEVTWHNDAPLGSFSNVAFYRLMQRAREIGIKVVLSGQGADEMFCGYKKYYFWAVQEQLRGGRYVAALKNIAGSAMHRTVLTQFSLAEARRYLPASRIPKSSLLSRDVAGRFSPVTMAIGNQSVRTRQLGDFRHFSVPYLTHYEDRASMAHGVEVRLPFLDNRLVETALAMPLDYKVRNGWTKYVLRHAFKEQLPRAVLWRRDKQGFSNPQESWLANGMREELDALFRGSPLIYSMGLLDRNAMIGRWEAFLEGREAVWHRQIFSAYALEHWLQSFKSYLKI